MKETEQLLLQALAYTKLRGVTGSLPTDQKHAMTECYLCKYKVNVPGNAHIECINPDLNMLGAEHGIRMGWFIYPFLFDPTWKMKTCDNFKERE